MLTIRHVMLLFATGTAVTMPAAISGCDKYEAAATQSAREVAPIPVSTFSVQASELQRTVKVVGTLAAQERVTISNRVVGIVTSLNADLGDTVKPGQVLAEIEPERYQLIVEQARQTLTETLAKLGVTEIPGPGFDVSQTAPVRKAQGEFEASKAKFERNQTLYRQQLVKDFEWIETQADFKARESELQSARDQATALIAIAGQNKAAMELKRRDLQDATIIAPSGISPSGLKIDSFAVASRQVGVGEYLREGTPMFVLVADRTLKLRTRVPERFLAQVRPGAEIHFQVGAYPGEIFSGKIAMIDPTVDETSRTFLVEAWVDNSEGKLRPGSFIEASILTRKDTGVVLIPKSAISSFAGVVRVFKIDPANPGKAKQAEIQTGQEEGERVEIIAGVAAGDLIAASNVSMLTEGAAITVSK